MLEISRCVFVLESNFEWFRKYVVLWQVNATLRAVQEEKDSLENKLKIENDARHELEGNIEILWHFLFDCVFCFRNFF